MIIQGRYIGRTQYGYQGMNIIHNKVYPIEICPNEYGYNYVVKIHYSNTLEKIASNILFSPAESPKKVKAWIPYDKYPSKYWVTNIDTNYELIGLCNNCAPTLS